MGMNVPDCLEWQQQLGFQRQDCNCVRVIGHAVQDCITCNGSGTQGIMPHGVHDELIRTRKMPSYVGDPRFDPRAAQTRRWLETAAREFAEDVKERKRFHQNLIIVLVTCAFLFVMALITVMTLKG